MICYVISSICTHVPLRYRHIAYQDEAPVLVTNSASIVSLNTQVKTTMEMRRFRPNIVIDAASAWEEDAWEHLIFCRPGADPNTDIGTEEHCFS